MSRALRAWGCYSVAMETRQREKWFMMESDGWSTPEVKVKTDSTVKSHNIKTTDSRAAAV